MPARTAAAYGGSLGLHLLLAAALWLRVSTPTPSVAAPARTVVPVMLLGPGPRAAAMREEAVPVAATGPAPAVPRAAPSAAVAPAAAGPGATSDSAEVPSDSAAGLAARSASAEVAFPPAAERAAAADAAAPPGLQLAAGAPMARADAPGTDRAPGGRDHQTLTGQGPAASGSGASQAVDVLRLHARLAQAAERCYPPAARPYHLRGSVEVAFCVQSSGDAAQISLVGSTGSGLLDAAARGCVVQQAAPFPADSFGGCFKVPVRFGHSPQGE